MAGEGLAAERFCLVSHQGWWDIPMRMTLTELARRVIEETARGGYDNPLSVFERVVVGVGADASFDPEGPDRAWLEGEIEEAFARHDTAAATWPDEVEGDRLSRVFTALTAAGIECHERCGFDQQHGLERVTDAGLAREELTGRPTRGFCFFHQQDVDDAVAGHGLRLTFGSWETSEAPVAAPVVCATCSGRGWIQPDAARFPEPCPSHQPTRVEPARTNAQRVGDTIVAALHAAGFTVEWSGEASQRLLLSNLSWRRRRPAVDEAEVATFLRGWELELRATQPLADPFTVLHERAADWFSDRPALNGPMLRRFEAHTLRFLDAERALEARWNVTDNDRLSAALHTLEGRGVFVRERLGKTLLDGFAYAGVKGCEAQRGLVFFHDEDVIDAAAGDGLWLAFVAFPLSGDTGASRTEALGREVVEALDAHGLSWDWSGSAHERIRLSPFTWQRRRWTTTPAFDQRPPKPFAATRSRADGPTADASLGELVVGLRDEGGFDLRRARRLRDAWRQAGHRGEAQVGSAGTPHAFVRAGAWTSMMPVAAVANLLASEERLHALAATWRRAR